jgi:hypothetical protein
MYECDEISRVPGMFRVWYLKDFRIMLKAGQTVPNKLFFLKKMKKVAD